MSRVIPALVAAIGALFLCAAPATAETPNDDVAVKEIGLALAMVRAGTKVLALTIVPIHQFPSFDNIITHESSWDVFAVNASSGAYGLGQALPPEKMSTHGHDWRYNPVTQLRWTYDYMNERYGGPDRAWAFWQENHWY